MKKSAKVPARLGWVVGACAVLVSACGGGGGGSDSAAAAALALAAANNGAAAGAAPSAPAASPAPTSEPASAPPPAIEPTPAPRPVPVVQAKCAMDNSVAPSVEEQRLTKKFSSGDALTYSQQLLQASGFDGFGPAFAAALCTDGLAGASTYDDALALVAAQGRKLWQAAIDRVQGRAVTGTLPASDDRMLYWARLTMTLALRQWQPSFPLSDEQRAALQLQLEKSSRGQDAIDFPEGSGYRRILVSGFDPFTLDSDIRIGNPSGATILSLDGTQRTLPDGSKAVIRTFILPVNYGPFKNGMQEDTLGPWFKPGPKQVSASLSMSQGVNRFDLEQYNGRYHHASIPGNDNLNPVCKGPDFWPGTDDCDITPTARWLGYEATPWRRDSPPQFTEASLPYQAMIDAKTQIDPASNTDTGYAVVQHSTYELMACTRAANDAKLALNQATQAKDDAWQAYMAGTGIYQAYADASVALDELAPPSPLETNCAQEGGGGNYLSNESAYRNTLLRDVYNLSIPAGHIHTPIMTRFASNSGGKITDSTFEARRAAIVGQARRLVFALADTLGPAAAKPAP